ncbi:class I SAM-dependent methyltransferase [Catenovulum sp. SM1970]|uniref:class I SAM-dependent methyltransferase n=1 Tax=Marinifaba aquimaris TaxID=2741323 RepID=UPI001571905D|nr:class I SAM-dependent methyltransferase [Marinifaba aquimaris]NTS78584.1 class I SAM-dependent methyltransferase [Marinifaba aquimaris]
MTKPVLLVDDTQAVPAYLTQLASDFDLAITSESENDFVLVWHEDKLQLLEQSARKQGGVFVDFASPQSDYRRGQVSVKKEAIAKACGLKANQRPYVLDATAGLARDAFVLATLGCKICLVERNPAVAALLSDGIKRGLASDVADIISRMQLVNASSIEQLIVEAEKPEADRPDVVYLDPMYPHPKNKKKAAAVKKEMKSFQGLVGEDLDADGLLDKALACAKERVVVKRPGYAEPLAGVKPSFVIDSKKNRFDVYKVS